MKLPLLLTMAGLAATIGSAQVPPNDKVLPRIKSFVSAQSRPGAVPRDAEPWLPVLRWAANTSWPDEQFARNVSWTLVRYEWWNCQGMSSPLAKAAAQFNLSSAVQRLRQISRGRADGETIDRLLLAQGYLKEFASDFPSVSGSDQVALRSRVRDEINRQVNPSSTSDANRWLQITVRAAFVSADDALVTATLARGQALESLEHVYGTPFRILGAAEARDDAQIMAYLSSEDKQGFFESDSAKKARDWLQQARKSGPAPTSRPDTVIGNYTKLRQALELGPGDLLSAQRIDSMDSRMAPALTERVFHVNQRDLQIRDLLTGLVPASRAAGNGATSSRLGVSTNLNSSLLEGCSNLAELANSDGDGTGKFADFVRGTTGSPRLAEVIKSLFASAADHFNDAITPLWNNRLSAIDAKFDEMGISGSDFPGELDERHRRFASQLWECVTPALKNEGLRSHLTNNASPEMQLLSNTQTNAAAFNAAVRPAGQGQNHPAQSVSSERAQGTEVFRALISDFDRLKKRGINKPETKPSISTNQAGSSPTDKNPKSPPASNDATNNSAVAAEELQPALGPNAAGTATPALVEDNMEALLSREAFWAELDSRLRRHAYLEAGQLVENSAYRPFLEGTISPGQHLAAGSALHERYTRAALALLESEAGRQASSEGNRTARESVLNGLQRSDFHLSQATDATNGNERKEALLAIQRFHRALIDEYQRATPVVTAGQVETEVKQALGDSLREGDLAAVIIKPSEAIRAAIQEKQNQITGLAEQIAINSTMIDRLSPTLQICADKVTRFKVKSAESKTAFENDARAVPDMMAEAGFAPTGQTLTPFAQLPEQGHKNYKAVETYYYLLTGGSDEATVAKNKALKYQELSRQGGVLFDQRTFGQYFLKWAFNYTTATYISVDATIQNHFRAQSAPGARKDK